MNYFSEIRESAVLVDVRSPSEYCHAHIPNAVNIPLFSDEERAIVGTTYKKSGREAAVKKALSITSPKFPDLFQQLIKITDEGKTVPTVYCARGGMRSEAMCFLLGLSGIKPHRLKGGYKKFRNEVLNCLRQEWRVKVLGGYTGSRKTEVLNEMMVKGHQVLDLEELAKHRGSSFGAIPQINQPSSEYFENLLALRLSELNLEKEIWVEDESRLIGKVFIPDAIYNRMRIAPVLFLNVDFETRSQYLFDVYGKLPKDYLIEGVRKIERRLGGAKAKEAIQAISGGELMKAVEITLKYYDKAYEFGLSKREQNTITKINNDQKFKDFINQYN